MNERSAENDAQRDLLMEVLIDFAEWRGDCASDAEWAADHYLNECDKHTLSPATRLVAQHLNHARVTPHAKP